MNWCGCCVKCEPSVNGINGIRSSVKLFWMEKSSYLCGTEFGLHGGSVPGERVKANDVDF